MTSPSSFNHSKPLPVVAQRYAQALFDLAESRGQLPMVEADLAGLRTMLGESEELRRFLANPLTPRGQIASALDALFGQAKFSALSHHFFQIVTGNGRTRDIPVIIDGFFARLAASRGEAVADVTSAHPLSAEQGAALSAALVNALSARGVKSIRLDARIDKNVLGGLAVQVGAWMYNGTLKGRLQELGRTLKNT